jgi:hypothetical protein
MANIKFTQFLRQYGILLLPVQYEDFLPGIAAEKQNKGYTKYANLSDAFGQSPDAWKTKMEKANIVTGNVKRTLSLKGKASIEQFGVGIEGGLSKASSVEYTITGIKAMGLVSKTRADIEEAIAIMKKDQKKYKRYQKKMAVDKIFFANAFNVKFETAGNVDLQAEIELNIKLAAGTSIEWTSKRAFTISNNDTVPFGFSYVRF